LSENGIVVISLREMPHRLAERDDDYPPGREFLDES